MHHKLAYMRLWFWQVRSLAANRHWSTTTIIDEASSVRTDISVLLGYCQPDPEAFFEPIHLFSMELGNELTKARTALEEAVPHAKSGELRQKLVAYESATWRLVHEAWQRHKDLARGCCVDAARAMHANVQELEAHLQKWTIVGTADVVSAGDADVSAVHELLRVHRKAVLASAVAQDSAGLTEAATQFGQARAGLQRRLRQSVVAARAAMQPPTVVELLVRLEAEEATDGENIGREDEFQEGVAGVEGGVVVPGIVAAAVKRASEGVGVIAGGSLRLDDGNSDNSSDSSSDDGDSSSSGSGPRTTRKQKRSGGADAGAGGAAAAVGAGTAAARAAAQAKAKAKAAELQHVRTIGLMSPSMPPPTLAVEADALVAAVLAAVSYALSVAGDGRKLAPSQPLAYDGVSDDVDGASGANSAANFARGAALRVVDVAQKRWRGYIASLIKAGGTSNFKAAAWYGEAAFPAVSAYHLQLDQVIKSFLREATALRAKEAAAVAGGHAGAALKLLKAQRHAQQRLYGRLKSNITSFLASALRQSPQIVTAQDAMGGGRGQQLANAMTAVRVLAEVCTEFTLLKPPTGVFEPTSDGGAVSSSRTTPAPAGGPASASGVAESPSKPPGKMWSLIAGTVLRQIQTDVQAACVKMLKGDDDEGQRLIAAARPKVQEFLDDANGEVARLLQAGVYADAVAVMNEGLKLRKTAYELLRDPDQEDMRAVQRKRAQKAARQLRQRQQVQREELALQQQEATAVAKRAAVAAATASAVLTSPDPTGRGHSSDED